MKAGRNIIKDMLCNNVILKAASIIFAVAMWLLVINIDDPQVTTTIKNIPVLILNESAITGNDEAYDILSGDTVDIKVTGPRTIVDSLTKDDFTATADFKDLSKTSAVPIDVSINNTRYESKITISEKSQNAMRLSVMALVEKEYEIGVDVNGTVQQEYVLYEAVPREKTVVIKAPEAVHKRIGKVALRLNLLGSENESFSYLCGAVAYDYGNTMIDTKTNHMTISNANITVDGVVYYRKSVEIKYNIVNNMGTEIIMTDYEVSADRVDIAGSKELLDGMIEDGTFITDRDECYYIYELTMDGRTQTGLVACASIDDYADNIIKKHENTRADKEADRIHHVDTCDAQTGPIFLAYRANETIRSIMDKVKKEQTLYSFTSDDGIRHQVWKIGKPEDIEAIRSEFEKTDSIYIADGHHRAASAVKVGFKRREENPDYKGDERSEERRVGKECM